MTIQNSFTYLARIQRFPTLLVLLIFVIMHSLAEGQTIDSIRVNATSKTNLDTLESIEKVLFLQRKDGHGKASIVPENRRIIVCLTQEPIRIRGKFTIQDEHHIEIKNQLIALDSIRKIKVPRKKIFLRIFGGIEFTLAIMSITAENIANSIVTSIPFIVGAVFILTTSRKYNLVNKYKVKVLLGNSQLRQQSVGMSGNNLGNFSSFYPADIDLMCLTNR